MSLEDEDIGYQRAKRETLGNFQEDNWAWIRECFGEEFARSKKERALRFIEEALEVVQASGLTQGEALTLVDYVFSRPVGEVKQEVGGAVVCLAALCSASEMDMMTAAFTELERCKLNTDRIRQKHAGKGPGIRTGHE